MSGQGGTTQVQQLSGRDGIGSSSDYDNVSTIEFSASAISVMLSVYGALFKYRVQGDGTRTYGQQCCGLFWMTFAVADQCVNFLWSIGAEARTITHHIA